MSPGATSAALIECGLAGFVLMFAFDWLTATKPGAARGFLGLAGLLLLAAATAILFILECESHRLLSAGGIIFSLLGLGFLALMAWSLFFELPQETYVGKEPRRLVVDTGTWALCRHPGLLWFAFGYGFLALASGSGNFALAAVIWTVADIVYVIVQERFVFRKIFEDYERYISTTPMLVPTRESIARCLETIGRRPGGRRDD